MLGQETLWPEGKSNWSLTVVRNNHTFSCQYELQCKFMYWLSVKIVWTSWVELLFRWVCWSISFSLTNCNSLTYWWIWDQDTVFRQTLKNKAHKANNASAWWHNDCKLTWLHEIILDLLWLWLVQIDIPGCVTDWSMDWQTDGLVDHLIELRRCIKRA